MSEIIRTDYSPLVNIASGMGTSRDTTARYSHAVRPYYHREQYNIYYRSSWACRRVVETMPRLMSRQWGKFTFARKQDKPLAKDMVKRHKELHVKKKFKEAQYWANLHGRSYILMVANEEDFSKPLDLTNKKIEDLVVLDNWKMQPECSNAFSTLYPEYYYLMSAPNEILILPNSSQHNRFLVHKSRVLVFSGNPLPDDERQKTQGSEASLLEPFINVWVRYFSGNSSLSHLLNTVDVFIHAIDGLFDMLWQGGDEAERKIQERLEANILSRSAYRGFAVDKDKESLEYASRNLGGIAPLSERQEAELVAASGLPKSVLFGSFAAGLDASGKTTGEQRYLNDLVQEAQGDKFEDNLGELNRLLWQEKDTPNEPEDWGWKWVELYQETKKEKAEIFKIYAEGDRLNIASQIYRPDEARTRHEEDDISNEISLDENNSGVIVPNRADDSTPAKKIIKWNDFEIGLQYLPFEKRHGKTLKAGYGHFRKTKGADGMAVDVYVGTDLESEKVFVVEQVIDGNFDEEKVIIGVWNLAQAKSLYLSAMPAEFLGSIREIPLRELNKYRSDNQSKLIIEGEVLSDTEFAAIANVEEEDMQLALTAWQENAPDKYKNLLDA